MPDRVIDPEAYRLVLKCVFDGHPDRHLAIAQIDGLIAQMMMNHDGSVNLQKEDPLLEVVERIRRSLK